jgi:hypothetical protein
LSAPTSPGFQLVDVSPTLVEAPTTPKELAVGVLQSVDASSLWPQNYSLETTPYWWTGVGRSAYHVLGVGPSGEGKPFSGLRFTSFSAAFLQKDMLPDGTEESQKIFTAGFRTTALTIRSAVHRRRIESRVQAWLRQAEQDSEALTDPDLTTDDLRDLANTRADRDREEGSVVRRLQDELAEKPLFTLQFAGAYGVYGIADAEWRTGRWGGWATAALNLPLSAKDTRGTPARSYLSVLLLGRYLRDEFSVGTTGLQSASVLDGGGRLMLQVYRFSLGLEGVYRSYTSIEDGTHRIVGTLSYRVKDNVFVNGAFGQNFDNPDKLISLFGIALGFGEERISMPGDAQGTSGSTDQ